MTTKSQTRSEPLKFFRDIIWVATSQVFTTLLGIITLPVLTKTYTTEDFGIWAQVSATVSLIVPLLTLQFGSTVVRFLAGEDDKAKRRRSLGAMLSAILIFASLMLVTTSALSSQFSDFLFADSRYTLFVHLTFIWTFIDALFVFFIAYLRARRRMRRLSIIQMFFSASKMLGLILVAKAGLTLEWIIISLVLIELVFVLGVFYLIVREEGFPTPNFEGIGKFLAFSIPQVPSGVLLWIIEASDRFFITHFLDLSQTGVYSTSNTLAGFIALFYAPISFVLLPAVSKAWEQKQTQEVKNLFQDSTRLFLTLAIPAAVGLAILSQPLLKTLATSAYLAGWELVLLISIGTIFLGLYQINLYIMYLVRQTKWLPLMIIAASGTSAGVNFILIPRIGILAAAISNIAAYFVLATIVSIWARKTVNYSIDFKYLSKVVASSLVMALCLQFLKIDNIVGIILAIIIGIPVFGISLFLLRGLSEQDKWILKHTISGVIPWIRTEKEH